MAYHTSSPYARHNVITSEFSALTFCFESRVHCDTPVQFTHGVILPMGNYFHYLSWGQQPKANACDENCWSHPQVSPWARYIRTHSLSEVISGPCILLRCNFHRSSVPSAMISFWSEIIKTHEVNSCKPQETHECYWLSNMFNHKDRRIFSVSIPQLRSHSWCGDQLHCEWSHCLLHLQLPSLRLKQITSSPQQRSLHRPAPVPWQSKLLTSVFKHVFFLPLFIAAFVEPTSSFHCLPTERTNSILPSPECPSKSLPLLQLPNLERSPSLIAG